MVLNYSCQLTSYLIEFYKYIMWELRVYDHHHLIQYQFIPIGNEYLKKSFMSQKKRVNNFPNKKEICLAISVHKYYSRNSRIPLKKILITESDLEKF